MEPPGNLGRFRITQESVAVRRDNGMADTREELRAIEESTVDVACHLSLIRVWDPTREEAG